MKQVNIYYFAGANILVSQTAQQQVQWNACLHHVLELLMEAAIVEKLGPTTGPTEKYFARFQSYFNSLETAEKEVIRAEANGRLAFVAPEDEVSREFLEATKAFFANYGDSYQRGDYMEFARLVKVYIFIFLVLCSCSGFSCFKLCYFSVSHRIGSGVAMDG